MSDCRHSVELAADTIVFSAGEMGDEAYYVESGYIDIVSGTRPDHVIATRGPGEIFGEMAIIDGAQRSASARTKTRCRLMRLSAKAITREFDRAEPIMRAILTTMLLRLREQNNVQASPDAIADAAADRQVAMLSAIASLRAETELADAIQRKQIGLYYQPIIELSSRQVVGFEGLARWHHPDKGTISPAHFIDLAERTGQIGQLTQSCLAEAVATLPQFQALARRHGMRLPYINVNVSNQDLIEDDFTDKLDRLASPTSANRHLRLEITESALIVDPERALRTLNACRAMGFGIAIDDFGTGYSSLAYLHQLPIDVLKIDRSFIQSMATNAQSRKIVGSIVKLAELLELPTVSEGLESLDDVDTAHEIGCDFGQGFYFARPMAFDTIPDFLASWVPIGGLGERRIA